MLRRDLIGPKLEGGNIKVSYGVLSNEMKLALNNPSSDRTEYKLFRKLMNSIDWSLVHDDKFSRTKICYLFLSKSAKKLYLLTPGGWEPKKLR